MFIVIYDTYIEKMKFIFFFFFWVKGVYVNRNVKMLDEINYERKLVEREKGYMIYIKAAAATPATATAPIAALVEETLRAPDSATARLATAGD